jgi:hemolysin III
VACAFARRFSILSRTCSNVGTSSPTVSLSCVIALLICSCIFAATMVLLYCASTVYHALPESGAKRVFRVLDHSAIYLLIAGTYTPFAFGALRGAWGWSIFGTIWGIALAGLVLKIFWMDSPRVLSTSLYVAMGWIFSIGFWAKPLINNATIGS